MTDLTPEEMSTWDPELTELLKDVGPIQFVDANSKIADLRGGGKIPPSAPVEGVEEVDRQVEMRDGHEIRIRIYRPTNSGSAEGPTSGCPLLIWYHGGGFCVGSIEGEEEHPRMFCKEFGGVAVSVDYRLAPEWKYPTAVNDAFDVLKWVATNFDSLGAKVDPRKGFLLGGVSAGGTLVTIIAHLYRDASLMPSLSGLFTSIFTCAPLGVPIPSQYSSVLGRPPVSWEQNKDAPLIGRGGIVMFQAAYDPVKSSPLCAAIFFDNHKALPPTYIQVCGLDPMRDYGLLWQKLLQIEDVATKLDVYSGLPHGFWAVWKDLSASKRWKDDCRAGWRWLLTRHE